MKIEIQNKRIPSVINFMFNLSIKGKKSVHRTRFIKDLQAKWDSLGKEETELIISYTGADDQGNPKTKESNGVQVFDITPGKEKEFNEQRTELFDEHHIIEGGNATGFLKTVKDVVMNYDEEVSGTDADIFEYLFDIFENINENKQEEEAKDGQE